MFHFTCARRMGSRFLAEGKLNARAAQTFCANKMLEDEALKTVKGPLVLIHDGNMSNRNQTRALAHAIGLRCSQTVELNIGLGQTLPRTPTSALVIGCGRRVAKIVSSFHGVNGNKTVQILHPRMFFSTSRFDCLVIPFHDELSWFDDEHRIVRMHGALSWSLHCDALKRLYRPSCKKRITAFIGGAVDGLDSMVQELAKIGSAQSVELSIVCSRRTPSLVCEHLSRVVNAPNFWHPVSSSLQKNPYRSAMANTDIFLVSEDSISMIADVLTAVAERNVAPPIYLLRARSLTKAKHERYLAHIEKQVNSNLFVQFSNAEQVVGADRGDFGRVTMNETARVGREVRTLLFPQYFVPCLNKQ